MTKEEYDEILPQLAETPAEIIYAGFVGVSSELASKADELLLKGATPEFIFDRESGDELPKEVRDAMIRALYWRQNQILNPKGVG